MDWLSSYGPVRVGSAHHQGEAADHPSRAGRGPQGLRGLQYSHRHCGRARSPCGGLRLRGAPHHHLPGGAAIFDDDRLLDEIRAIHAGGGFGSIIDRNSFQRPKAEALRMLGAVMDIYAVPKTAR